MKWLRRFFIALGVLGLIYAYLCLAGETQIVVRVRAGQSDPFQWEVLAPGQADDAHHIRCQWDELGGGKLPPGDYVLPLSDGSIPIPERLSWLFLPLNPFGSRLFGGRFWLGVAVTLLAFFAASRCR
jgi:hypothetical protein